ncbi:MAG: zeta toxin family protein [Patescibacteria group bacterium]
MPENDQQLIDAAYQYIRDHEHELIERFADPKVYKPSSQPVTLFMAGSPGAGKTEVSKRLIEVFTGNLPVRIDADDIRIMFPNYTGMNSHIFQRACTKGVHILFDHALHKNMNAILDGTFAYEGAMDNLERSLNYNRRVIIYYLFQDPAVAWKFTQIREAKEGRRVSKEVFINSFLRARENVDKAKAHFGDKIELNLFIKDFSKDFEKLYDNIERLDKYLPIIYTQEALEQSLL